MCGFAAFFSSFGPLPPPLSRPEPWIGLLRHRGPDAQASWAEPGAAIHFARLSILDLSEQAMQPMRSSCRRYVIAFNGEIVNYRELADRYRVPFRGHSDTEVLLELYRQMGPAVIPELRGMYSFLIYDTQERSVAAYRDPFGIKPLYYAQQEDRLLVCSQILPLLKALGGSSVRSSEVVRFLRSGEVDDGEETLFERVQQLPAGQRLLWKGGNLRLERSGGAEFGPPRDLPDSGEKAEHSSYYETLMATIGEYLHADVPVGVSLSGGFDSSLLAHLVSRHPSGGAARTMFTRAYHDYEGNELEAARQVSEAFGFDLHPVVLRLEEVPDLLRHCSRAQEQPVTSISILAYHKLYALARSMGIKVLLEGHGGDEIWAGYGCYRENGAPQAGSQDGSSFRMNEKILLPEHSASAAPSGTADLFPGVSPLARRQLRDLFGAKLQRSLRYVDRASMENSVEVRVPYLDTRVALPALTLPDRWKVRGEELRSFVRRMALRALPGEIALRPKVPIQDPQRKWLQRELRQYVEDVLNSDNLFISRFVDVSLLNQLYRQFLETPPQFDNLTFLVFPLFLEEWHRAMRDQCL